MESDLDTYLGILADQDNYQHIRPLRESATEQTDLVEHKGSGRRFVRKSISSAMGAGRTYRLLADRLQHVKETSSTGAASSQLPFPHIHQCFSTGEKDVVIMEYVEGTTLDQALLGSDRAALTKQLFPQICKAACTLHSWGLIHRDLKPSNIMVRNGQAVLIDFGAARMPKDEAHADTNHFGTVGYAPPEQYGFAQTDQRSDVYALGMLLGFCLTGAEPHTLPPAQFYEAFRGKLDRTSNLYLDVIKKATRPDPSQRYSNANELLRAFTNASEGRRTRDAIVEAITFFIRNGLALVFLLFSGSIAFSSAGSPSKSSAADIALGAFIFGSMFLLACCPFALLVADPRLTRLRLSQRVALAAGGPVLWVLLMLATAILSV